MTETPESLDERQLAERAGVDVEAVRRYTELGLLKPADAAYSDSDVARVRLIGSCERGGLPLEGMAQAVERGMLSFAFLDLPKYRRFGTFSDRTYGQAAAEASLSFEFVRRVHEAVGLSTPESEDDRIRQTDLLLVRMLGITAAFGIPEDAVLRTVRVYADGLRRITDAESQLYRDRLEQPMLESGMPLAEVMRAASAFGAEWNEAGDVSLLALYHRHQESSWLSSMVSRMEEALEQLGVYRRLDRPPAMVFLDISGYTRLTEERRRRGGESGGHACRHRSGHLAASRRATREVARRRDHVPLPGTPRERGGRPRDGGAHADGGSAARARRGLGRAGRDAGRRLLRTDGEPRRAHLGKGRPRRGPRDDRAVEASATEAVRFEEIGKAELKGFTAPVVLHRATRA